jgi:hypothetical protein
VALRQLPFDDRLCILLSGVVPDPSMPLRRWPGGDKFLELHRVQPGKLPKIGAETTGIEIIFSVDPEDFAASDKVMMLICLTLRRSLPKRLQCASPGDELIQHVVD